MPGDLTRCLFLYLDLVRAKAPDFHVQRGRGVQNQNVLEILAASSMLGDLTRCPSPCHLQLVVADGNWKNSLDAVLTDRLDWAFQLFESVRYRGRFQSDHILGTRHHSQSDIFSARSDARSQKEVQIGWILDSFDAHEDHSILVFS